MKAEMLHISFFSDTKRFLALLTVCLWFSGLSANGAESSVDPTSNDPNSLTAASIVATASQFAAVSMVASTSSVKPGERVTYTITFTNRTQKPLSGWRVTATVSDHTTVPIGDRSYNVACSSGQGICRSGENFL